MSYMSSDAINVFCNKICARYRRFIHSPGHPTGKGTIEQILFVQSGKFELALEGEKITVKKNELVVIPSNKNHSGIALSDCKLIDVVTPKREEYNN